jgi:hypothetical protein
MFNRLFFGHADFVSSGNERDGGLSVFLVVETVVRDRCSCNGSDSR